MSTPLDELTPRCLSAIHKALWAGDTLKAISRDWEVSLRDVGKIRDQLFAEYGNPDALKAAANGPVINACSLNRPKAKRTRRSCAPFTQIEMFPER